MLLEFFRRLAPLQPKFSLSTLLRSVEHSVIEPAREMSQMRVRAPERRPAQSLGPLGPFTFYLYLGALLPSRSAPTPAALLMSGSQEQTIAPGLAWSVEKNGPQELSGTARVRHTVDSPRISREIPRDGRVRTVYAASS